MAREREASSASYSCELNSGFMSPDLLSLISALKPLIMMASQCYPIVHMGQQRSFREGGKWLSSGSMCPQVPTLSCATGKPLC